MSDIRAKLERCQGFIKAALHERFQTAMGDRIAEADIVISEVLTELEQQERIEGCAWLDGDNFCPECRGQVSRIFVPWCEHETSDEYHYGPGEEPATLIIERKKDA